VQHCEVLHLLQHTQGVQAQDAANYLQAVTLGLEVPLSATRKPPTRQLLKCSMVLTGRCLQLLLACMSLKR
jgi:hypothetical protein